MKVIKIESAIQGLITPEKFVQIRWNDLQRCREAMKQLESITTRGKHPRVWSYTRRSLNAAERMWAGLCGR